MFTKKVGTMNPGWSQQPCVPRGTHPFGFTQQPGQTAPGQPVLAFVSSVVQTWLMRVPRLHFLISQPGTPAQAPFGFPHGMQRSCSHVGKLPAAATVNVVEEP